MLWRLTATVYIITDVKHFNPVKHGFCDCEACYPVRCSAGSRRRDECSYLSLSSSVCWTAAAGVGQWSVAWPTNDACNAMKRCQPYRDAWIGALYCWRTITLEATHFNDTLPLIALRRSLHACAHLTSRATAANQQDYSRQY